MMSDFLMKTLTNTNPSFSSNKVVERGGAMSVESTILVALFGDAAAVIFQTTMAFSL